ncbi:hypothetical protein D3C81_1912390 [compost metagenome]
MGKASKPGDDCLMPFGVIEVIGKHRAFRLGLFGQQLRKARNRLVLHRQVLAMLEHQVDEHLLDRPQLPVEIRGNTLRHELLGTQITGIGFGVFAKDHSR